MKILYVINSLHVGGAERMVVELSKAISKYVDIHVLSISSKNNNWSCNNFNETNVHLIEWYCNLYNPIVICKLIRLVRKEKYDIVHSHLTYAQIYSAISSFFISNVKWITTEHSSNNNRRRRKLFRYIDRFIYSRFSNVYSISQSTQTALLKWLKYKLCRKFEVFPNGVNLNEISKAVPLCRLELGYAKDDFLLMMVGRMEDAKDPITILKSLKKLPNNYKLILIGEGSLYNLVVNKARELGVYERVKFVGAQNNISEWLKMADLYIQSSHWEGLPTAPLEAMAASVLTIGSRVPGIIDLLPNDMLFEHENENELATLILCEKTDWRRRQENIVKKYDLEYLADIMFQKYKLIIGK